MRGWMVFVLMGLAACSSKPQEPYFREDVEEMTAQVAAVNYETRLVSLRDDAGHTETVYAGPEVRNLEQIKIGDEVVVSYHSAVAAMVTTPQEATTGVDTDVMAERAAPGEKPYGAVGAAVTTTVKIDSVDTSFNTVTFRRDDGLVRTVGIQDPEARKFIKGLKPGDLVLVTYAEAVAVSVRPSR